MKRLAGIPVVLGTLLLALACSKSDEPKPAPAPSAAPVPMKPIEMKPVEMKPIETAPLTVGGGKMVHCPTTVPGASVAIMDVAGGVELVVTATDKAATDEIVARAKHLAEASKKDPADAKHTGEGEGGGALGKCPVVLKDTTLVVADAPGGAKITVKPTAPAGLAALKTEVRARHAAVQAMPTTPATPGGAADPKPAMAPTGTAPGGGY